MGGPERKGQMNIKRKGEESNLSNITRSHGVRRKERDLIYICRGRTKFIFLLSTNQATLSQSNNNRDKAREREMS